MSVAFSRLFWWRPPPGAPDTTLHDQRSDPETGLWRMPAFAESAEEELARAARFGRPLALLVVEIERPEIASRERLQRFATALRSHTRGFDLIGRQDDGSFVVLLPETGRAEVPAVRERIRREAAACLERANGGEPPISPVRLGTAIFPGDGLLLDELLAAAAATFPRQPVAVAQQPAAIKDATEHLDDGGLRFFVGLTVLVGLVVLALLAESFSVDLLTRLLPLLALAAATERLASTPSGRTTVSLGVVVSITGSAIGGPAAGALLGLVSGLVRWHTSTLPPLKGSFNAAIFLLSAAASGWMFQVLGANPRLDASPLVLVPGFLAGLVFFLVNYGLLAKVVSLATGTTWLAEWRRRCNWLILHHAGMGVISLGGAALYQSYGLTGLALFVAPVALLYYAQRQYLTHTAHHVAELSTLNQELTGSNQRLTTANERLARTLGESQQANRAMVTAFSQALETRDQETEGHSQRVVYYAYSIAQSLGLAKAEIETVVYGALLHDLGKIGIPDAILRKKGPLDDAEWVEMKRHSESGYQMIANIPFLAEAAPLVRHHHEHWNGRGYPAGLAGAAIPLGARIFAVADAFDAMTSDRPYKKAMTASAAIAELRRCSGEQFDPEIVTTFVDLLEREVVVFPVPAREFVELTGPDSLAQIEKTLAGRTRAPLTPATKPACQPDKALVG